MLSEEARASLEDRLDDFVEQDEPAVEEASTEADVGEEEQPEAAAASENDGGEGELPSHEESVPYERFKQLNESNAELKARLEQLEQRLAEPEDSGEVEEDDDFDPLDVFEQRISRIEHARAVDMLTRELNDVKDAFPAFKESANEDLLLDMVAANPRKPVKQIASRLAALLKSPEVAQEAQTKQPPETPNRPKTQGASPSTRRKADRKKPSTFKEASALLRERMGADLTL